MWAWIETLSGGAGAFLGSLAGALFGLLAILAGALYNAHLNRKRDDELRRHESMAVARALRAELLAFHSAMEGNIRKYENPGAETGNFLIPSMTPLIKVFPALMPKLGLLQFNTQIVLDSYAAIEQIPERLVLLGATTQEFELGRATYILPVDQGGNVATLLRNTLVKVAGAVEFLNAELGEDRASKT